MMTSLSFLLLHLLCHPLIAFGFLAPTTHESAGTSFHTRNNDPQARCFARTATREEEGPTVAVASAERTGPNAEQEDMLDELFTEALNRVSFFMETDVLFAPGLNKALKSMFQTCVNSVYVAESTIPEAGRGLFAGRDIPEGTIVALYPIHAVGCKFRSGLCQSVQMAQHPDEMIDHESSAYALFSFGNRPLCGVDLQESLPDLAPVRLFVDMNPKCTIRDGWLCGYINDAATVRYMGDEEYYPKSRSAQNVEIVPFSVAPFQAGVTTRDVRKGEEFFVSYGYNYWVNNYLTNEDDFIEEWTPRPEVIAKQEEENIDDLVKAVKAVESNYEEAAWALGDIFDNLSDAEDGDEDCTETEDRESKPDFPKSTSNNKWRRVSFRKTLRKAWSWIRSRK